MRLLLLGLELAACRADAPWKGEQAAHIVAAPWIGSDYVRLLLLGLRQAACRTADHWTGVGC